jgi:hypothetical protein
MRRATHDTDRSAVNRAALIFALCLVVTVAYGAW